MTRQNKKTFFWGGPGFVVRIQKEPIKHAIGLAWHWNASAQRLVLTKMSLQKLSAGQLVIAATRHSQSKPHQKPTTGSFIGGTFLFFGNHKVDN